jgi:hypothetical protein
MGAGRRNIMRIKLRAFGAVFTVALALGSVSAFAQHNMGGMAMKTPKPTAAGYRFELAGPAKSIGGGKSIVAVRLVQGGKPVTGAIIIQSRADMGPMNMASMTAPIKPLGEKPPGTYSFEVASGPIWNKPDDWALTFAAKVQGMAQTVTGSVIVKLSP